MKRMKEKKRRERGGEKGEGFVEVDK